MTKSEKVSLLGIFSPKTILMFRVGLKKRVGRPTGTTHISFKPLYSEIVLNICKTIENVNNIADNSLQKAS